MQHLEAALDQCVQNDENTKNALLQQASRGPGENAAEQEPLPCQVLQPSGPSAARPQRAGANRRKQLLTLLFLGTVGLRRTSDLRHYTGDGLPLLSERAVAYSSCHIERFLANLAKSHGAEELTDSLSKWTAQLWEGESEQEGQPCFYVDGHRKPVYSQRLVPRGVIGRSGKILGCRALTLLHDEWGHPRLALTDRGDQHLTVGLPSIVARYAAVNGTRSARIIVDREGMGAAFLQQLAAAGQTMVTLLRSNQYAGLESFTQVGPFLPLDVDKQGRIQREVAPACFALPLPDHPGQSLPLRVALIRDWRRLPQNTAVPHLSGACDGWDNDAWEALPSPPATAPAPPLIAIVTTAAELDAGELARTYTRRWPVQENIIRDFLLPLGLDTNHGYAKTPVVNSEVVKRREIFQKQLENAVRWLQSTRAAYHSTIEKRVSLLERLQTNERQYQELVIYHRDLDKTCVGYDKLNKKLHKKKDQLSIQQEKIQKRVQRLSERLASQKEKCQRYAQKQCDLLRLLEDLTANERTMYELDNRKDQIMTVFKVAVTNLIMWTRDQYFPDTYSSATWERLAPFFRLPGIVRSNRQTVSVSLRPFHERSLNRDLILVCQLVNQKQPHLPDGRQLTFSVQGAGCLLPDEQVPRLA